MITEEGEKKSLNCSTGYWKKSSEDEKIRKQKLVEEEKLRPKKKIQVMICEWFYYVIIIEGDAY